NKTDNLDVHGLNRLQRNGTLPTEWIPPRPLRDLLELTRTRLVLVEQRTLLKNSLTATRAKYGVRPSEYSDAHGQNAPDEREARMRADVNRYLKWAFVEAANSVAVNHRRCPERHVSQLL